MFVYVISGKTVLVCCRVSQSKIVRFASDAFVGRREHCRVFHDGGVVWFRYVGFMV